MPAGHVILVTLIALMLGAVFNAPALSEAADNRPFGWRRTVAVVAVAPIKAVSGLLRLDRPHRALARAAADARGDSTSVAANGGTALPPPPAEPDETAAAPPEGSVSVASAPRSAARTSREVTPQRPLRVWVGGDSLASEFGPALAEVVSKTGRSKAEVDFRYSTGLTRPDFFDWPAHLGRIADRQDPDVFVVMFGANDAQDMSLEGDVLPFGSPAWKQAYAERVRSLMDLLSQKERTVYWMGQPIMQSAVFDARMQLLNDIYRSEAAGRGDAVTFISSRELFAQRNAYAPYLADDDGQRTLMRQQDGVHLTRAGGHRLAAVVFARISQRWSLQRR